MFHQQLFGKRLLEVRTSRGEKQPDLAAVLGISITQVSEMENGKKGTTCWGSPTNQSPISGRKIEYGNLSRPLAYWIPAVL